jgi:hypothetical protein
MDSHANDPTPSTAAVERLRASKEEAEDSDRRDGYESGWAWGLHEASRADLRDLAEHYDEGAKRIGFEVRLPKEYDRPDGYREASDPLIWCQGFADGVVAFWERVAPRL